MNVANILAVKGSDVFTIKPAETIAALSERLREKRIGAVIVSDDGKAVDGVISERDIAYGIAVHKGALLTMPVSALMTKTVFTCSPQDKVSVVASTMLARNVRHLPVVDEGRLVGMISMRDVLKLRLEELQREASMLRAFASETGRDRDMDR